MIEVFSIHGLIRLHPTSQGKLNHRESKWVQFIEYSSMSLSIKKVKILLLLTHYLEGMLSFFHIVLIY